MSSYCRIVLYRSTPEVESVLLETFGAEALIPSEKAEPGDLILSEAENAVALDEIDAGSLLVFLEGTALKLLSDLSRGCDTKISAIAVQTGVGYVAILVVDRGSVVRHYVACEGKIELDEGRLPEWDDRIRDHAWNAADDLVGIVPWTPPPSLIGTALRKFGQSIGLLSAKAGVTERKAAPSGLMFGEPVGAISTKRYRDWLSPQAESCVLDGGRLVCILNNGNEMIVLPAEIDRPFTNPFTKEGTYLKHRDGRVMKLPDSVSLSEIEQWLKTSGA